MTVGKEGRCSMPKPGRHETVCENVFVVGGPELSGENDCLVYLVDLGDLVLIDCGAGASWPRIRDNIASTGRDARNLHTLIATHAHVDHIGAIGQIKEDSGARIVAHSLDAEAIETGDDKKTAAGSYGIKLAPVRVDHRITGEGASLPFKKGALRLIHTPGHTPGSMVAAGLLGGKTILWGQDIHGPFSAAFGSDVAAWRASMEQLLTLHADILCEGHYGVISPASAVYDFIIGWIGRNAPPAGPAKRG
jgi:glyoxylase-like metal-dependent hydrolase (beta-lactamase superfamily II)